MRKTNEINFKSNYYSVPQGTYRPQGTEVYAKATNGRLEIFTLGKTLICTHPIAEGAGKTVINTDHKRDKSQKISDMMESLSGYFTQKEAAIKYFGEIRSRYARYIRDQLHVIRRSAVEAPGPVLDETLDFCIRNSCFAAPEFEQIMYVIWDGHGNGEAGGPKTDIKPMDGQTLNRANQTPEKSNMADYENIIDEN